MHHDDYTSKERTEERTQGRKKKKRERKERRKEDPFVRARVEQDKEGKQTEELSNLRSILALA